MITYLVTVRAVEEKTIEVKAGSEEEAKRAALAGRGKVVDSAGEEYEEVLEISEE